MNFISTKLEGAYIIEVDRINDERGFFGRIWCKEEFENHGLNADLKQSNVSFNKKKGTLRGLHYQRKPFQETKLLRCTRGAVYDVIVDVRPESSTFKEWIGVELTETNYRMIYVPEGFAHGYLALEDNSEVYYMVTEKYSKESEGGIRWDDPNINIKWPLSVVEVSEKDASHADFNLKNI